MNDKKAFINRELSWLDFNQRVLEKARDEKIPLFERLKFSAIFQSNLDEFFMIRIGALSDHEKTDDSSTDNKTELTPKQQIIAATEKTRLLTAESDKAYKEVTRRLAACGIIRKTLKKNNEDDIKYWRNLFNKRIRSVLAPQMLDSVHAYPFIQGLTVYVFLELTTPEGRRFALVPVSNRLPKFFVRTGRTIEYVLAEDMVLRFADELFEGCKINKKIKLRVTRNADIGSFAMVMDSGIDALEGMEMLLRRRKRLAPLRLEMSAAPSKAMKTHLMNKLKLKDWMLFVKNSPLEMGHVYELASLVKGAFPQLFYRPVEASGTKCRSIIDCINRRDMLLAYPFNSFDTIPRLLEEAAADRYVKSISISLYRVAHESRIIAALIRAANAGKKVTVVVELRARFDEENNITWAKRLEDAGCAVVTMLNGMKVHSKLFLIEREFLGRKRYISHVGTGNFNEDTAKIYTDISFLTAKEQIASEISALFEMLKNGQEIISTDALLISPYSFKVKMMAYIDNEINKGENGRIFIKCNSVSDRDIILKLFEASAAGVKITMVVRGICCFRAGVPGVSDNISVKSVVGRLLEHSRIFIFGDGESSRAFIGSADFLTRNTERRIEVTAEITDPLLKQSLLEIKRSLVEDTFNSHIEQPDGSYSVPLHLPGSDNNSQLELFDLFSGGFVAGKRR